MSLQASRRKMLFVSSMPASQSNAIGIQILHLAERFTSGWRHCYWDIGMGTSGRANSYCLNSSIPRRWPYSTGRGFLTRTVERIGLGWWHGDHLIESRKGQLRRILENTGFAYVAPLGNSEATRCREIMETIECPFAVHLWDFTDMDLNADYLWLFSHAEHVFYLSPSMIERVDLAAHDKLSPLPFTRPPSKYHATFRSEDTMNIGVVGFLFAYPDGMELLRDAIGCLRRQFAHVQIRYVGQSWQLQFIPDDLRQITEYFGLLNDNDRDRVLADCTVGYLPGPLRSPYEDMRSRYSVPSRSADYMAVGLPVIAAVHGDSATNSFFSPVRGRGFFPVSKPEEVCSAAEVLRDDAAWERASVACLDFFDLHFQRERVWDQLWSAAAPHV